MEALPGLLRAYRVACGSTASSCVCAGVKKYFIPRLSLFLFSRVLKPLMVFQFRRENFPNYVYIFYISNVEEKYSKGIAKIPIL